MSLNRIEKLIPLIRDYYSGSDPAHDWAHVGRVAKAARVLSGGQDVDTELVLAAVYCHDLINLPKDHKERKKASTLSAEVAAPLLVKAGFNPEDIEAISAAIIEHSFSRGLEPSSLIGAIVQDADRLDALGAIGVLRCAAVNTQMQSKFYDAFDPLAEMRDLDDKSYMLDHYFVKLFKLPELMNTSKGKELAIKRVKFMQQFIQQLMQEIR